MWPFCCRYCTRNRNPSFRFPMCRLIARDAGGSKVNHPLFALAPDDDFPCSKINVLDSAYADFNQSAAGAIQQFKKSTVAQDRSLCQKPLNLALREDAGQLSWNLSGTKGTRRDASDGARQGTKSQERPQTGSRSFTSASVHLGGEIGGDEIRYVQGHNLAKRFCLDVAAEKRLQSGRTFGSYSEGNFGPSTISEILRPSRD